MRRLLLPILIAFAFQISRAQTDTLFWFAAPEVSISSSNFDRPIVLRITTYTQPATVTITQPAGAGMPAQVVNIPGASTQTVDLTNWIDIIESKPPNTALNYGLKVQSTAPVSMYYEVVSAQCQCNPEIFVLKGQNAIGSDFWIPSQNYLDNNAGYSPQPFSSFDIVATQDNTNITITPSNALVGHAAGVPFTITLNTGQTFSNTAASNLAAQHLQGSRVTSDKPIAITVKDDLLTGAPFGGCADLGGDEIVPTAIVGTEYIAMNGFLNSPGDQLFVTATQNGTNVSQNGTLLTTINAGQTYQVAVGGPSTYIQTSNPAYVWQLSGIGCEVGLDVLPPIVCTGSFSVSFTRSTTEAMYINLAVRNGGQGNFLVNGAAGVVTAAQFNAVPGTGGTWVAAQIPLPNAQYPQNTAITVTNSTNLFHLGLIHGGGGSGTRFGYFSNFAHVVVNAASDANDVCNGSTIQLTADTIPLATYSWTGPNSFASSLQNPPVPNATALNSGNYIVIASFFGCTSNPDTVNVQVQPTYAFTIDTAICQGYNYTLPAGGVVNSTGSYVDTLHSVYGCDSVITTNLTVHPVPVIDVYDSICNGNSFIRPSGLAATTTGVYTDTLATVFGCDSIINTHLTVNPTYLTDVYDSICNGQSYTLPSGIIVSTTGNYTDTLPTVNGCDSIIVTHLTVNPSPATDVFDTICAGNSFTLPSGNSVNTSGLYTDTLPTIFGCDSIIHTNLTVLQLPVTNVFDTICSGQTYTRPSGVTVSTAGVYYDTLSVPNSCDSVVITNLTVNPTSAITVRDTICPGENYDLPDGTTVNVAGTYPVTLTNQYGCDSIVTTILSVITVNLSLQKTDILCNGENNGTITATASGGLNPYGYDLLLSGASIANDSVGAFNSLRAGNYTVNATDNFGCSTTNSIQINEPTALQTASSTTDVSCYGNSDGAINLTGSGGNAPYTYKLNNVTTNSSGSFSALSAGSYSFTVLDANNCPDTGNVVITQPQAVEISVAPDSVTINLGESIQLNATSNYDPSATYQWNPAIGLSCSDCPSPIVDINSSMAYKVIVTANINGKDCSAEKDASVTVIPNYDIFIPNSFTPNGDGNNDEFRIFGKLQALKFLDIKIFNRIGEKVFESNDINFSWDGAYKGKAIQPTVLSYTLQVVFIDNHAEKLFKGTLTLIR